MPCFPLKDEAATTRRKKLLEYKGVPKCWEEDVDGTANNRLGVRMPNLQAEVEALLEGQQADCTHQPQEW